MSQLDRRTAIAAALATGASTALVRATEQQQDELTQDQELVMEAGMTREEADCWKKIAEATAAFFALPELHPADKQEVATAVHVIQNKLLARPTYRKYLELAKAQR